MEMYNIEIVVTLKEPAVFASGHEAGNLIRTQDYIPGNVILGAFARRFLHELKSRKSASDLEFKQFFLSDAVRFENLYPAGGKPESLIATTTIPFSTLTCKDYPRPCSEKEEKFMKDKHPYTDFLLGKMVHECDKCDAPLKNREGFYYTVGKRNKYDFRVQPEKVVRMHNVIEDRLQRPTEEVGGVFSFEALEEEQSFRGFIGFYDETVRDDFKNTLVGSEEKIDIVLGRARSRGYGEAELRMLDPGTYDIPGSLLKDEFDSRWEDFQAKMKNHFSITLHSDAIVTDKFLCYHTTLTKSIMAAELGINADTLKLKNAFSRFITLDGFSGVHGLPLESEIAIEKGSAFLFEIVGIEEIDEIKESLQRVEEGGIGFRRNEGFGRLIVCDGYHLRKREGGSDG
jgi:CRISPR-associated protein Csx10